MTNPESQDPLFALLRHLPRVPEAAFCRQVMLRVQREMLRRKLAMLIAWCSAAAGIVFSLPMEQWLKPLAALTQQANQLLTQFSAAAPLPLFSQGTLGQPHWWFIALAGGLAVLVASMTLWQD